jgi:hypothetical protein
MNITIPYITAKQSHYKTLIKESRNTHLIYAYRGAISALETIRIELEHEELYDLPKQRMN